MQTVKLRSDLQKARDTYMAQLAELDRVRPKADEGLLALQTRLDAEMTVAGDDLVRRLDGSTDVSPQSGCG